MYVGLKFIAKSLKAAHRSEDMCMISVSCLFISLQTAALVWGLRKKT
jgi:hypothetical protein